jgi:hypothetical protein
MASAYDEIKRALAMLRQGSPITEQSRAELNRVRRRLENEVAMAELVRHDLRPIMLEPGRAVSKEPLANRPASES